MKENYTEREETFQGREDFGFVESEHFDKNFAKSARKKTQGKCWRFSPRYSENNILKFCPNPMNFHSIFHTLSP